MNTSGWLQLGLYVVVLLLLAKPLGAYMAAVYEGRALWAQRIGGPLERLIYRGAGVDSARDMGWIEYALAMLWFNLLGALVVYGVQRLQQWLPLNPQDMAAVSPDSAFNTATSFITNTNWQGYGGESDDELSDADAGARRAEFRLGGHRDGRARRADSRLRAQGSERHRQLLDRSRPHDGLHPAAAVDRPVARAGEPGRAADVRQVRDRDARPAGDLRQPEERTRRPAAQGREGQSGHREGDRDRTDDSARARRVADRDQAARHQRRRLLQRQFGAPVRKPDAAREFSRGAVDPADRARRSATRSAR